MSPIDVLEAVFSCKISEEDLAKSRAHRDAIFQVRPICPRTSRLSTFSSYNTDYNIRTCEAPLK